MITLENLQLQYGGKPVLKGVSLNIREKECLAVVGPNGCGKSSLLRLIAGREEPDEGEVRLPKHFTVGYLPQEADLDSERTVREELREAFREINAAQEECRELEKKLAEMGPEDSEYEALLERYGDRHHLAEQGDVYAQDAHIGRVSAGLGFSTEELDRPCRSFSGGWKMRILLAQLLLRRPDVMLLDEPTNHLDLETTLWLENWVRQCGRTVLLVSHERATMDRLAHRILCLEQGRGEMYTGSYSRYLEQSAAKREALWMAYEQQQKEIGAMENFIRRFRATASRASLVQSRIKALEKIERIEPPFHPTAIHFSFPEAPKSYTDVITLENLGHSYDGQNFVFRGLDLTIRRGEKIGLVGLNGAGKSTLLKILAGKLTPSEGAMTLGGKVEMQFFAQYDSETLSSENSLLQAIEAAAPQGEAHRARDLLGAFLFSGDTVDKPLSVLSGGERTRFRLARLLFSPANLLLLDEPTNHLDVTSRSTVEEALRDYTGTVIVVSHDRIFMERVTDKVLEIDGGNLHEFPGDYRAYLEWKESRLDGDKFSEERAQPGEKTEAAPDKTVRIQERQARKDAQKQRRKLEKTAEKLEREIEEQESRLAELEQEMARPEIAASFEKLSPLSAEREQLAAERDRLMAEWESTLEAL